MMSMTSVRAWTSHAQSAIMKRQTDGRRHCGRIRQYYLAAGTTKGRIDRALSALREIGSATTPTVAAGLNTTVFGVRPMSRFSAATRRKMALAQRRRYAALRVEAVGETGKAKPAKATKRKMSAEGLANIRAAVKRRWAMAKKHAAAAKKATVAKKAVKKSAAKKMTKAASANVVSSKGVKKAVKKAGRKVTTTTTPVQSEAAVATTTTA